MKKWWRHTETFPVRSVQGEKCPGWKVSWHRIKQRCNFWVLMKRGTSNKMGNCFCTYSMLFDNIRYWNYHIQVNIQVVQIIRFITSVLISLIVIAKECCCFCLIVMSFRYTEELNWICVFPFFSLFQQRLDVPRYQSRVATNNHTHTSFSCEFSLIFIGFLCVTVINVSCIEQAWNFMLHLAKSTLDNFKRALRRRPWATDTIVSMH